MAKLAIKSDNRRQNLLLPPSLDEPVPENHMVRVVDAVIYEACRDIKKGYAHTPHVVLCAEIDREFFKCEW